MNSILLTLTALNSNAVNLTAVNVIALRRWLCMALLVTASGITPAQAANDGSNSFDPPGRVGRLSEVTGQVWMFSPSAGEWLAAVRNRPLTSGDRLSTDAGARAEVQIGSTTLRLDSGSELEVLQLDDNRMALQLHSGAVSVRLRQADTASQFELRTAEGRFRAQRTGRYRFDRQDGTSQVTVLSGQAYFEGQASALSVRAGQRAEFWLDNRNAAQYSLTEPVRDAFASYNADRDQRDDRSASSRYVSPEMTGVEDLDRSGRWEQNADYGALWVPRVVAAGWVPYAVGHWAFVSPWGWTWIDDAPWGFAPFHYGRWVYLRDTWAWAPGTFVARPVYAPALVAWIGSPRASVGISIGGGYGGGYGASSNFSASVGWFPLAPREVYVPSYRVSPRYVEQVNITHVTNITNITTIINNPQQAVRDVDFSNRKFHHAITTVPEAVMTGRANVAPAAAQWRAANPGRFESQERGERGAQGGTGRGDDAARNASTQPGYSPPMMTMAAAPVAAPAVVPTAATAAAPVAATGATMSGRTAPAPREAVRAREFSAPPPSMAAPNNAAAASPLQTARPSMRNAEDGTTPRGLVDRPVRERDRERDAERARTPEATRPAMNAPVPPPVAAPAVPAAPAAQGRNAQELQRASPAVERRPEPRAVPAAAPSANPAPAPARMEGPRAAAREGAAAEPRKQSQDERNEGRRNNSQRAVE